MMMPPLPPHHTDAGAAPPPRARGGAPPPTAGAVTRRGESLLLARCRPDQNMGARPHATADEYGLADSSQRLGQAQMPGPKRAGCSFAMDVEVASPAVDSVRLDLASIVRDVIEQLQPAVRKEVTEDAARIVAEDLTVRERAVDRATHCAEIALPDLRVDRRAG